MLVSKKINMQRMMEHLAEVGLIKHFSDYKYYSSYITEILNVKNGMASLAAFNNFVLSELE